jgi:hypothetical protein
MVVERLEQRPTQLQQIAFDARQRRPFGARDQHVVGAVRTQPANLRWQEPRTT